MRGRPDVIVEYLQLAVILLAFAVLGMLMVATW